MTRTVSGPTPLGVGLLYNPSLPRFLRGNLDAYDYVEVIPEMFWTDRGRGADDRFVELEAWVRELEWLAERKPVVAHNISFSLGTAGSFDHDAVARLAAWRKRYGFAWHSDHLSFVTVSGSDGHDHNAGLAVPLPFDREVLDLVAGRIRAIQESVEIPFLVENNVYFIDVPEQEMSEPAFLNALAEETGCGLLLDLHNLYANARNHGIDSAAFLDELDLERVGEIHIAGGSEMGGMWTDSHSGPSPEAVWELLDAVVPRAPNLRGITFEFHDSYYPNLKEAGIRAELERARSVWREARAA
ncbi:MAG: DUF692 domain-containing protein [Thermoanaerobaculia bacterium]